MNYPGNHIKLNDFCNESDSCKILDFIRACDCFNNLHILIYLLENKKFIYSNSALKNILGNYSIKILNKGWDSWFDIVCQDELLSVKNKIEHYFLNPFLKLHMF